MEKLAHMNRIKVQQPRGRSGWCRGCDTYLLRDGHKCPVCGYKENAKRAKKLSPIPSEVVKYEH